MTGMISEGHSWKTLFWKMTSDIQKFKIFQYGHFKRRFLSDSSPAVPQWWNELPNYLVKYIIQRSSGDLKEKLQSYNFKWFWAVSGQVTHEHSSYQFSRNMAAILKMAAIYIFECWMSFFREFLLQISC